MCIPEHRYLYSEDMKFHDTTNGWTFISASAWKNSVNVTIGGIGILIRQTLKSLNNIEEIQPRIMVPVFNGSSCAIIISC